MNELAMIHCKFAHDSREHDYIGSYNELMANIRTTWSKVRHYIKGAGLLIEVYHMEGEYPSTHDDRLAVFTFTPIAQWPKLPGHF